MLHNLTELTVSINSKGKRQPKKPDSMDKLYPELWRFITGNNKEEVPNTLQAKDVWVKLGMVGELPGG